MALLCHENTHSSKILVQGRKLGHATKFWREAAKALKWVHGTTNAKKRRKNNERSRMVDKVAYEKGKQMNKLLNIDVSENRECL